MSKHEELIERVMDVPCYTEDDAKALAVIADELEAQAREIEGLRKDAERYRAFIDCGQPICFLGKEYFGKEVLDAAIDAVKGAPHG
jgi:hypothetical protein